MSSTSASLSSTASTTNSPIIYCNFIFPIGLNATVEIKDIPCSQFTHVSSNTNIYNEGEATAVLKPTITTEERMSGQAFTHEYCARIDILFDKNGDGVTESVLYNRFMIPITYRFETKGGNNSSNDDVIISASIAGNNKSGSSLILDTKQIVGIAIGAVIGSFMTLLFVLLLCRFKSYRLNRRKGDQVDNINVEMPNGLII
ncbi:hypothetical protein ACHAXM_002385 [Skeletonema potamos]